MADNQEVQNLITEVNDLKQELEDFKRNKDTSDQELKRRFEELILSKDFQLKYPLDIQSRKLLNDIIEEQVFDAAWNGYFYYFEAFNSTESLSLSVTGASGLDFVSLPQPIFYAFTGANSGDGVLGGKWLFEQNILTFDKKQSIRTQIRVDSVTSVEGMIGTGDIRFSTPGNGFGFYFENATLKGVVNRDSVETLVTLQTIAVDTTYFVEARLDPDLNRVVFFVNNIEKGQINTVPLRIANETLWQVELLTNSAAAKEFYMQTFEIIQRK